LRTPRRFFLLTALLLPVSAMAQDDEDGYDETRTPNITIPVSDGLPSHAPYVRTPHAGLLQLFVRKNTDAPARLPPPGAYARTASQEQGFIGMTATREFSARLRLTDDAAAFMKFSVIKPGLRAKTGMGVSSTPPLAFNLFGAQVVRIGVKFAY